MAAARWHASQLYWLERWRCRSMSYMLSASATAQPLWLRLYDESSRAKLTVIASRYQGGSSRHPWRPTCSCWRCLTGRRTRRRRQTAQRPNKGRAIGPIVSCLLMRRNRSKIYTKRCVMFIFTTKSRHTRQPSSSWILIPIEHGNQSPNFGPYETRRPIIELACPSHTSQT